MWKDDAYLLDMLLAARKVRTFTAGVTERRFLQDEVLQLAVMRLLEIIGEAARKISEPFRASQPGIPWAGMIGMRHRLVHEYFRIIPERVWDAVLREIDPLIEQLEPLVPPDRSPDRER